MDGDGQFTFPRLIEAWRMGASHASTEARGLLSRKGRIGELIRHPRPSLPTSIGRLTQPSSGSKSGRAIVTSRTPA